MVSETFYIDKNGYIVDLTTGAHIGAEEKTFKRPHKERRQ